MTRRYTFRATVKDARFPTHDPQHRRLSVRAESESEASDQARARLRELFPDKRIYLRLISEAP